MSVRRVVTGVDPEGRTIVASDDVVSPVVSRLFPGSEFYRMWGGDSTPFVPNEGHEPNTKTYFPNTNGFRFGLFTLPGRGGPKAASDIDRDAALAEFKSLLPGLLDHQDPDGSGMHTTPTVDIVIVLSGSVKLDLGDALIVHLEAGDTVVQNGTRHRWLNHGATPAVIAFVNIGATTQ